MKPHDDQDEPKIPNKYKIGKKFEYSIRQQYEIMNNLPN